MRKDRAVPCPLRCVHLLSEFQSEWNLDDKPKIRRQHAKYKCNKRHRFKVYSFVVEFFYGKLTTNQKWSKRPRSTLLSVLRVLQLWEESLSDLLSARLLQIPDLHLLSTKPAKFTEMSKAHHASPRTHRYKEGLWKRCPAVNSQWVKGRAQCEQMTERGCAPVY